MALPKLDQNPVYDLIIPSTGEKIEYRPFLVKEQKILLIALETNDDKQVLKAIRQLLKNCIISECNVNNLAPFDIEYIFLQLRGKAVGENSAIQLKCGECEEQNDVNIPLADLFPIVKEVAQEIKIGEEYILHLRYPSFGGIIDSDIQPRELLNQKQINPLQVEELYGTIMQCLESLDTEEEKIYFKDETLEAKEEFVGSLTTIQFESILKFVNDMPKITHDVTFNCVKCDKKNELKLEGMQAFF